MDALGATAYASGSAAAAFYFPADPPVEAQK